MTTLSILSLNVRGLNNQSKRNAIFQYLKDQNCCLYLLQETYSQKVDEKIWSTEWGSRVYFSHGSSHSRGTCVLFHPKFDATVENSLSDPDGRILVLNINTNGSKTSIVNV